MTRISNPGKLYAAEGPQVILAEFAHPSEMPAVQDIFREYATALGVDLCFQNFETELAGLPGE